MNRHVKHFLNIFIVALILHTPLYSQKISHKALDYYIDQAREQWGVPGVAVGVVKDGKLVYRKGFGEREIGKGDRVDGNTLFAIASNSKAFTATAIGLLVSEGKFSWDDPVIKYLPDFQLYDPVATRKITLRDLLCHRSGLGTWSGDLTWFGSIYDQQEVIRRIRFQPPAFDFRTGYGYSNLMFVVAGAVIEKVTGQSWGEFIESRIFKPLGMERSNTTVTILEKMENVAQPHTRYQGELVTIPYRNVDNAPAPGAINSSVNDLARWLIMQMGWGKYQGKTVVDSQIVAEMRKPHTLIPISAARKKLMPSTHFLAYGLGWFLTDYEGRFLVYHTGGLDGMFSFVGFIPEENLGVVVLTNLDDHQLMRALAFHLFDAFLGIDFKDWNKIYWDRHQKQLKSHKESKTPVKGKGTSLPLSVYAGTYRSEIYGKAAIREKDGELTITLLAHPNITGTLTPYLNDIFLARWSDKVWNQSYVNFDVNEQGEVEQFRVKIRPDWIDPLEYVFKKEISGENR
ncbi:MAG: serine hydrolase [Calditrichaeota bacterium]|nr:MAG: serine hydrolase [Calditrichota bacterium]